MFNKIFALFIFSCLWCSCATYEAQYRNPNIISSFPVSKEIEKTFYLIGDGGKSPDGSLSEGLQVVQNYLKKNPAKGNYAIFLGDNIYPNGMPALAADDRKHSEHQLDAQINSLGDFEGTMYFIPGNHDWYNDALVGLKREADYLTEISNGKRLLQPEDGCPISSVSVTDNIQLIMIDSQWYLEDWNKLPSINERCDIKTRETFFTALEYEIEVYQHKTIVFAMHHPMFTNGSHGGYFSLKKHLYPMQGKLPLPVLSSLITQIRAQGGVTIQDRYNELYARLMLRLGDIAKKHGRIVFASGHEHTLQYIEEDGLIQIQTGSAAKESAASLGKNGLFSSGAQGFAVMDVFKDGSSWVRYFVADENKDSKMIFQKEIIPPVKRYDIHTLKAPFPKEVRVSAHTQDRLGAPLFFNTNYGHTYKEVYKTPITAPVAFLDTLYGGLTPFKETKNKDVKTLHLKDKNGAMYTLRALSKNALNYLAPPVLDKTTGTTQKNHLPQIRVPDNFNSDFYTATHPYAALSIPGLAKPLGIFYATPSLFYVPKQKALQSYTKDFGDQLYYISLAPAMENTGGERFKAPETIKTTAAILLRLRNDPSARIDEETYISSRLFDMLIGDWDREPNHWRWGAYQKNGGWYYMPIPSDRDDAFSSFDAAVLDRHRSIFSGPSAPHIYRENLKDIGWFNEEGILLDRALLKQSGLKEWEAAAKNIQHKITNAVIEAAFENIPNEVSDTTLEDLKSTLKKRRDSLLAIAKAHHAYLTKLQTVTGTDKRDYFEITRRLGGLTTVKTYTYNGGLKVLVADKTYDHSATRELWVYGLDGDDTFVVQGEDHDLIYVRIIGGRGMDSFDLKAGRRIKAYDTEAQTTVLKEPRGRGVIFTTLYDLNTYDYRKQLAATSRYSPTFGYTPDDGLRTGINYEYTVDSFKRNPFSKRHTVSGGYYFDTHSFDLKYTGVFAHVLGDRNLIIAVRLTSPNYTVNYFGYGNETKNPEEALGIEYNRVELQHNTATIGLLRNASFGSVLTLKSQFDTYRLTNTETNLFQDIGTTTIEDTNYFATVEAAYDYKSFDTPLNPARGMVFNLTAGATENLEEISRVFGYLKSRIMFYNALSSDEHFVLKSAVTSQFNFGSDFEFYQGVQLGANNGLRGYREERFTGQSAVVVSADLRYSFKDLDLALFPLQLGVYAGGDLGRVWTPLGTSKQWHADYGGGLWIHGAGGFGTRFSAFRSPEGTRISFGLGVDF